MLAVTGIGMVSSLGLDVVTSCAAARAGIRRIGNLSDLHVLDEDAEEVVPLVGHQVPRISNGLFGFARLLQLAICAIDDLKRTYVASNDRPVGLILVLRSDWHRAAWIEQRKNAPTPTPSAATPTEAAPAEGERDFEFDQRALATDRKRLAEAFLPALVARARISIDSRAQRTILGDQNGFVTALEQAAAWLANGTCETCWVGGVDSYLDPSTIKALEGLGLLRTPANPVGLIPGELACFLALKLARKGQQPDALAVIESFVQSGEAIQRLDERPRTSEPLARVMSTAGSGRSMEICVVNLNGDTARASEWGATLVRRQAQGLIDGSATLIPPLYFGEIGSATGPASIALLARGWARGYVPADKALVCLIEEGPARGAISVSRS